MRALRPLQGATAQIFTDPLEVQRFIALFAAMLSITAPAAAVLYPLGRQLRSRTGKKRVKPFLPALGPVLRIYLKP
jgi:hypothetical protein